MSLSTSRINQYTLSSERYFDITAQPEETCPYNHPCHDSIKSALDTMTTHLSDQRAGRDVELDCQAEAEKLIELASEFESWLNDWTDIYYLHIRSSLQHSEMKPFEDTLQDAKNALVEIDCNTLQHAIDKAESACEEFSRDMEHACESKQTLEAELEDLQAQHLEASEDVDEYDNPDPDLKTMDRLEQKIDCIENDLEPSWLFSDAENCKDELDDALYVFGSNLQTHFEHARYAIGNFKSCIKEHLEQRIHPDTQEYYLINPHDRLSLHTLDSTTTERTLFAISPEHFIHRAQQSGRASLLSKDEKNQLDKHDCLSAALTVTKMDYPLVHQVVWYRNTEAALDHHSTAHLDTFNAIENEHALFQTPFVHQTQKDLLSYVQKRTHEKKSQPLFSPSRP
jgi:hypothetical protein